MATWCNGETAASDEQCVFVVAARLTGARLAQLADGLKCGAERAEERAAFARRRDHRCLHEIERVVDANREVGEQLVGALHLRAGELRGARRVAADRVQVAEQRLHFALQLIAELPDALRSA